MNAGPGAPASRSWWPLVALGLIVVLRVLLSSQHEVRAFWDDDRGYAEQSLTPMAMNAYGAYSHVRQPVYPAFVALARELGVPARVAIDGVWVAVACVVFAGLRRCGVHPALSVMCAAAPLLHPWSFSLLDRLLQDNLYAPMIGGLAVSLAAAMTAQTRLARLAWGVAGGVFGAVGVGTRPEGVLVYAMFGVAALVVGGARLARAIDGRAMRAGVLYGVALPLAMTGGFDLRLRQIVHRQTGLWAQQDLSSPGMAALFGALLSIEPGSPRLRVPIMRDVRDTAYELSPTFASLRPWIDGPRQVPGFKKACAGATGVDDEYGSWMVWAIRHGAWQLRGDWASAAELDTFYARAGEEIRRGMRARGLGGRSVPIPFVAPEWALMRADLGSTLSRVWDMVRRASGERFVRQGVSAEVSALFDRAALRRASLVNATEMDRPGATGWLRAENLRRGDAVKGALAAGWSWAAPVLAVLGLVGGLAGTIGLRRGWLRWRWGALFALVGAALVMRLGVVVLLDLSGVPAQSRYVLAAPWLLPILGALGAQAIVVCAARLLARGAGRYAQAS